MGLRILLIEDSDSDAAFIERGLAGHGHLVDRLTTTAGLADSATSLGSDVVILDRILGASDSALELSGLRAGGLRLPILMLTGMATTAARVDGLDAGADDYVCKPIDIVELDARLRALTRRVLRDDPSSLQILCGSLKIDRVRRETWRHGKRVVLQPREQRILEELASQCGRIVSRESLLQSVWNLSFDPRTKLIETQVSRLREKLNAGGCKDMIETVRGSGYRIRCDA